MGASAFFLAMRRLRAPILVLVGVFAVGITGLALIPGVDEQGRPWHMTIAEALYFMAYTATTIGFGEIPRPFTDVQRLWVTAIIFASVIGWAYLVASVLALLQDRAFRGALVARRFRAAVGEIGERFYLICGFGETGLLVARALDALGQRFVLVEIDEARVQAAELMGFQQSPPALAAVTLGLSRTGDVGHGAARGDEGHSAQKPPVRDRHECVEPTKDHLGQRVVTADRGRAESIAIGPISREDLAVHISRSDDTDLIGMNFLSSLGGWSVEGQTLVLRP